MRTLGVERVYSLGKYQTLRLVDSIDNLPTNVAFDIDVVDTIRILQFLELDRAHLKYKKIHNALKDLPYEKAIAKIDEVREQALNELRDILINVDTNIKESE